MVSSRSVLSLPPVLPPSILSHHAFPVSRRSLSLEILNDILIQTYYFFNFQTYKMLQDGIEVEYEVEYGVFLDEDGTDGLESIHRSAFLRIGA